MPVNKIVVAILGFFVTLSLTSIMTPEDKPQGQRAYAHDFSTTDESSLVTLVEQIKAETQLIITSFLTDENFSAHEHARKAAELLKDLEGNLTQTSPPSSDIIQVYDQGQKNSTTLALVVANIVDDILRKYGSAFDVGYDMTNMSNMVMTVNNSNVVPMVMNNSVSGNNSATNNMNMNMNMNMKLHTMNSSSNTTTQHGGEMSDGYSLVNVSDYQSAQALTIKASEIFNNKLKSTNMNDKNVTGFITNLDNGLTQLNNLVAKKDSPLDVMMVVHTQIHPNLLEAFNLELLK